MIYEEHYCQMSRLYNYIKKAIFLQDWCLNTSLIIPRHKKNSFNIQENHIYYK